MIRRKSSRESYLSRTVEDIGDTLRIKSVYRLSSDVNRGGKENASVMKRETDWEALEKESNGHAYLESVGIPSVIRRQPSALVVKSQLQCLCTCAAESCMISMILKGIYTEEIRRIVIEARR